ncbi:MAG: hypothetical protein ABEK59_00570 [Halobacteria archaeon]
MDIEVLRKVQKKERESDSLQELRDSFYQEIGDYMSELENERSSIADPFGPEAQRVNDTIQSARDIVDGLYERRVGKIIKLASLSANGTPVDESGMTREEREMYENIVCEVERNHETIFGDVIKGKDPGSPESGNSGGKDSPETGAGSQTKGEASPLELEDEEEKNVIARDMEKHGPTGNPDSGSGGNSEGEVDAGSGENDDSSLSSGSSGHHGEREPSSADSAGGRSNGSEGTDWEFVTVRVTGDIPGFVGVDGREYELEPEDVATVPLDNADPLCDKGVAERVN